LPGGSDPELLALLVTLRARGRRNRRSPRRRLVFAGVLVAVVLTGAALAGAAFTGRALVFGACSLHDLRPVALGENSFLYAEDGSLLGVIPTRANRQPLRLAKMSPWLPRATVAVEDRRFYRHGALDYHAIARALYADVRAGRIVEGGSTITQELVRNLYIGHAQRTLSRKLREACLAEKLAGRWTKRQILAAYLNEVYYGNHAYGAQAGAETYFSTSAGRLTLPQAALLAGLPQAPSVYDPFRHPRVALRRRDEVLRALLASRAVTRSRYATAVAAPLGLRRGQLYSAQRHPNFFGWAERELVERYGARRVEAGGLQVRTTLDPLLQSDARAAFAGVLRARTDPAGALVAIDPQTGAVRAMLSYLPDGRKLQFNLATQGRRQAGSAFKPIVLTTAIEQGISVYTGFSGPSELTIPDPRCSTNGTPWTVHNYADESSGYMNLLDATAHSVNTIYAQLVDVVGPANVVQVAHRMGVASRLDPVCSITLGTQAVTPLELTAAYATLAAGGMRRDPQAFELVRGAGGDMVGVLDPRGVRVVPPNAAAQVTYALQGVVQHGTGTAAALGERAVAGKTGTAESFQDAWFCGYVRQLAACVWIGYPKAEIPLENVEGYSAVFGGSLPAAIWQQFMSRATARLASLDFPRPAFTGHTVPPPPVSYVPQYTPPATSTTTATTTTAPTTTGQ
jgi:penicillin-binding protein 1A